MSEIRLEGLVKLVMRFQQLDIKQSTPIDVSYPPSSTHSTGMYKTFLSLRKSRPYVILYLQNFKKSMCLVSGSPSLSLRMISEKVHRLGSIAKLL
jgi:hypothetical protein